MILGVFGGHTPASLMKQRDKVAKLAEQFATNVEKAVADREAAISEIRNEIISINNLRGK